MAQTEKNKLPAEILVKRLKPNLLTLCFHGDKSARFFPGITRVTDAEIIAYMHNPKYNSAWKAQIDNGAMIVVKGLDVEKKVETTVFTAMNAEQAIAVVKDTLSVPQLEQMSIDEQSKQDRSTVVAAIAAQISDLEKEPEGF